MRIVRLIGEIGNEALAVVLDAFDSDEKHFVFKICGPGGDFSIALAIVDLMQDAKDGGATISTVAMGEVASASAMIAIAGSARHRYAFPSTSYGLHEPFLIDNTEDPAAARAAEGSSQLMRATFYRLMDGLAPSSVQWKQRLKGRSMLWLPVDKAKEFNLVDHIR